MNIHRGIALTLGFLLLAGCPGGNSTPPAAAPQPAATTPPPPPPPIVPQKASSTPAPAATPAAAPAAPPVAPAAQQVVQKKAEVGVGAKGRGYGTGPIATPAAAFFGMREKIVFNIQIPKAVEAFKTIEGRAPASNEEYMQKIIKENQIPLPQLFQGERYVYDPKTETLMVERPAE